MAVGQAGAVRQLENEDGLLIIDDTIQEKPYTDENALISWHFDHTKGRTVKGVNILNCLYHAQALSISVAFEIVLRGLYVLRCENPQGTAQKRCDQE